MYCNRLPHNVILIKPYYNKGNTKKIFSRCDKSKSCPFDGIQQSFPFIYQWNLNAKLNQCPGYCSKFRKLFATKDVESIENVSQLPN